jgi:hypothetical protein
VGTSRAFFEKMKKIFYQVQSWGSGGNDKKFKPWQLKKYATDQMKNVFKNLYVTKVELRKKEFDGYELVKDEVIETITR